MIALIVLCIAAALSIAPVSNACTLYDPSLSWVASRGCFQFNSLCSCQDWTLTVTTNDYSASKVMVASVDGSEYSLSFCFIPWNGTAIESAVLGTLQVNNPSVPAAASWVQAPVLDMFVGTWLDPYGNHQLLIRDYDQKSLVMTNGTGKWSLYALEPDYDVFPNIVADTLCQTRTYQPNLAAAPALSSCLQLLWYNTQTFDFPIAMPYSEENGPSILSYWKQQVTPPVSQFFSGQV